MNIVICVCTCGRPQMLKRCLEGISRLEVPDGFSVNIVVVDNEPPKNHAIVSEFGFHYAQEARRGTAFVRNKAVEEAISLNADLIGFLDDDQVPSATWLSGHLKAAEIYEADAVQCLVKFSYPAPAPFWCLGEPSAPDSHEGHPNEGRVQRGAGTGGVMFSSKLVREDGMDLRFDEDLSLSGGEDGVFFNAASKKGAKIVWSSFPYAIEEVSRSRLTYWRYVVRGLTKGGQIFSLRRRDHGYKNAVVECIPIFLLRMFKGISQIAISPLLVPINLNRFKLTVMEGGRNILFAVGVIGGLISFQYEYYRRIDGH